MTKRIWWKIGGVQNGMTPDYHIIDDPTHQTFCGIKLPESYGKFYGGNLREQMRLHCRACEKQRLRRIAEAN